MAKTKSNSCINMCDVSELQLPLEWAMIKNGAPINAINTPHNVSIKHLCSHCNSVNVNRSWEIKLTECNKWTQYAQHCLIVIKMADINDLN